MKKFFSILLLSVSLVVAISHVSYARQLVLVNETHTTITSLVMYRPADNTRTQNLLKGGILYHGFGLSVNTTPDNGWDIIIKDDRGLETSYYGNNFEGYRIINMYKNEARYK